jgi:hypothetical protein
MAHGRSGHRQSGCSRFVAVPRSRLSIKLDSLRRLTVPLMLNTLHPPQNPRVHKDHCALGHYFHEVTCTQLVPQISANAQNDNLLIELLPLNRASTLPPLPSRRQARLIAVCGFVRLVGSTDVDVFYFFLQLLIRGWWLLPGVERWLLLESRGNLLSGSTLLPDGKLPPGIRLLPAKISWWQSGSPTLSCDGEYRRGHAGRFPFRRDGENVRPLPSS